jgi:hypothetical protein
MRAAGVTRVSKIQLPVASADTRKKREALEQALQALEQENINLLKIRQTLSLRPRNACRLLQSLPEPTPSAAKF